jgi:hypothetical protein
MEDYKVQDNALTNNAVTLLKRNLTETERIKFERILDTNLYRTLDHLIQQTKNAVLLIQENPRFDWVNIQNEIDECFSKDKNATGIVIYLDWKEVEIGEEQRILIKGKIAKAS